jgi:hypothetical protein
MRDPDQSELDALTVNIELTLISIIQGVALYFLTENSHELIVGFDFAYWPYIVTGLLTIFSFWARSTLHILTVIRWPLDYLHTFFYFSIVFLESVTFTQIHRPAAWFFLHLAMGFFILLMFATHGRLVRNSDDAALPSEQILFEALKKDQMRNIFWLSPGYMLFNASCGCLILFYPEIFLVKGWQTLLGLLQLLGSLGYLAYSIQFFRRLSPLIRAHRAEQLRAF